MSSAGAPDGAPDQAGLLEKFLRHKDKGQDAGERDNRDGLKDDAEAGNVVTGLIKGTTKHSLQGHSLQTICHRAQPGCKHPRRVTPMTT